MEEEYGYPLTYNFGDPGNTSIPTITNVKSFSIFTQEIVGHFTIENLEFKELESPKDYNSSIDVYTDINSYLEIQSEDNTTIYLYETTTNIRMTCVRPTLTIKSRSIDLEVLGNNLSIGYFERIGSNCDFSYFNLEQENPVFFSYFNKTLDKPLNLSLYAEWYSNMVQHYGRTTIQGNSTLFTIHIWSKGGD